MQGLGEKETKSVAEKFQISVLTVKKYINMTEDEIRQLNKPKNYKKRLTVVDDYINIIFKMMQDNLPDDTIYFYIIKQGYCGNKRTLWDYIYCIGKNNFHNRSSMNPAWIMEQCYPDDVVVIKRNALLKYLLTMNPKVKKYETISFYIDIIKEKYPSVANIEEIFAGFHGIIMGNDPDKLDQFLQKYRNSTIYSFCKGLERDIASVKNAISLKVSSGFVEGNNNKFKLIKRIVYGRSGLINLSKKCFLAFSAKNPEFNLHDLI